MHSNKKQNVNKTLKSKKRKEPDRQEFQKKTKTIKYKPHYVQLLVFVN